MGRSKKHPVIHLYIIVAANSENVVDVLAEVCLLNKLSAWNKCFILMIRISTLKKETTLWGNEVPKYSKKRELVRRVWLTGVQAFCDSCGLDQVPTANGAGDVSVEISDQMLSVGRHLDSRVHRGQEITSWSHSAACAPTVSLSPPFWGSHISDLKTLLLREWLWLKTKQA